MIQVCDSRWQTVPSSSVLFIVRYLGGYYYLKWIVHIMIRIRIETDYRNPKYPLGMLGKKRTFLQCQS